MGPSTSPRALAVISAVLGLALPQPCHSAASTALTARDANATLPAPVTVWPDQHWAGIDGAWNTFSLRIGDPYQTVNVFVSTASQQTWAVHNSACLVNVTDVATGTTKLENDPNCFDSRGRTYNITASDSWTDIGFFQLWTEKNLGLVGNGQYGYDTVGLGLPGEEGPTLKNTTVGTLITPNFWLGHFGLNPKPTNFSAFTEPSPSYMTYLFEQKHIPSVSFGYTAGQQYRAATFLGSLTLGGSDTSRYIPNDLSFQFAPDNERDIVVGIVGINATTTTQQNINLLARDSFTMYIDSTIAELWLPIEVCEAFEKAFGLTYDNETELYLVDDLLHQTLKAQNASVTFSLGQKFTTNATVDIELPYSAFDLEASPPYRGIENKTRYFPIRRGGQENQYVLGRTFLQEAYLIVDWERQNFSVSQCNFMFGQPQDIVPIYSPQYVGSLDQTEGNTTQRRLSTGTIIGIAVGTGFAFALIICAVVWWIWRTRQKRKKAQAAKTPVAAAKVSPTEKTEDLPSWPSQDADERTRVFPKAELPGESVGRPELSTDAKDSDAASPSSVGGLPTSYFEVGNTERQIFEMPGDIPTRQEADGRQLSEKESMMVRERVYNGIDPTGPPAATPTSEEAPRRLAPVSPSDVAMVNHRLPNTSPTTPRTPRDGALLESSDTFFQPSHTRARRNLEIDDMPLSPISPLEGSTDTSRRRFSYES
ncbi:acid protease [Corynespora cassiicola Philippines]|uniref:Acid protease n=1 Tax=Corynespora cassiicola Philippines TaxID=1448308 RepID=A0A2T2P2P0_CORCC|nr:acid protease [Corynespora cassiicola Philippines]